MVVVSGGHELKKFDPAAATMNSFYPQKGNKNLSGVPIAFAASDAVRKMKRNSSGVGVSQPAACKKHQHQSQRNGKLSRTMTDFKSKVQEVGE